MEDQGLELVSDLLHAVSDSQGLQLHWLHVLFCHNVGVVLSLHASFNLEVNFLVILVVEVLDADLVVSGVKGGEVVSHFELLLESLQFFALGISNGQHQIAAV